MAQNVYPELSGKKTAVFCNTNPSIENKFARPTSSPRRRMLPGTMPQTNNQPALMRADWSQTDESTILPTNLRRAGHLEESLLRRR